MCVLRIKKREITKLRNQANFLSKGVRTEWKYEHVWAYYMSILKVTNWICKVDVT